MARIGVRILESFFFAGWVGSFLVILLSGIEDIGVIAGHEEKAPAEINSAERERP